MLHGSTQGIRYTALSAEPSVWEQQHILLTGFLLDQQRWERGVLQPWDRAGGLLLPASSPSSMADQEGPMWTHMAASDGAQHTALPPSAALTKRSAPFATLSECRCSTPPRYQQSFVHSFSGCSDSIPFLITSLSHHCLFGMTAGRF